MTIKEKIKKELKETLKEAIPLIEFFQEDKKTPKDFSFHYEYQNWYTKAIKVVEKLGPDRYEEFKKFYEVDPKRKVLGYGTYVIQDYIKGVAPNSNRYPNFDSSNEVFQAIYNQYTILASLSSRIDNILSDIETTLFAEIQDDELKSARELMKISLRASGALCGVIIESHLQKVCNNKRITIRKKNPGIGDLNELLKQNNVYETSNWRKIGYLADLRNICSHKKDIEPSKEQIIELIDGTNWLMKNIN